MLFKKDMKDLSGAELFVYEISKRLVQNGHNVTVLTKHPAKELSQKLPNHEVIDGIKVYRVNYLNKNFLRSATSFPGFMKEGWRIMKKEKIDLIHSHITYPSGIVGVFLKKFSKKPLMITIQGDELFDYPDKPFLNYLKPVIISTLKKADKIHSVSNALKKVVVKEGVPDEKVIIIPNGVDMSRFTSGEFKKQKIILTTSRLTVKNRINNLINAFALSLKHYPELKLWIAGDGPEEDNLKRLVDKLGIKDSVVFLGFVEHKNIPEIYSKSFMFVRAPISEGFGISFIEAMSAGLPTIASNVGGIVDIIQDGNNGLLVPPDNVELLAQAIKKIVEDEQFAKKLSENARNTVIKKYSWQTVTEQIEGVYEKLK